MNSILLAVTHSPATNARLNVVGCLAMRCECGKRTPARRRWTSVHCAIKHAAHGTDPFHGVDQGWPGLTKRRGDGGGIDRRTSSS